MITVTGKPVTASWGSNVCITVGIPQGQDLQIAARLDGQSLGTTVTGPSQGPNHTSLYQVCIRMPKGRGVGVAQVDLQTGGNTQLLSFVVV